MEGVKKMNISNYFLPLIVFIIIIYALIKKVDIYDSFIRGAKEGLHLGFNIFPCLIAMIFGINILLGSGFITNIFNIIKPLFQTIGVPVEVMPLAIIRPISGNASFLVMTDLIKNYGPDSLIGNLAACMQGATDTTIYVLSLYFGSIGIKKIRYALIVGLFADLITVIMSIILIVFIFG